VLVLPVWLILGNLLPQALHVRYSKPSVGCGFGNWLYGPQNHQMEAIWDVTANFD